MIVGIAAVLLALAALVALTRQLHFLQLNSYYNNRFWEYLRGAFSGVAVCSLLCAAGLSALFLLGWDVVFLITAAITGGIRGVFAVQKIRHAKKKLVFTARIKRMFVTAALLLGAAAAGSFWNRFWALPLMAAVCLMPFFAMLVNLINAPMEKAIAGWYVGDARRILKDSGVRVIGVTGSYGKTSTKYILGRILSEKYNVLITPESYNTLLGVVRTIRERLRPGTQLFIAEMGAKKQGDIEEICRLVQPEIGVITSIGPQHLNTFGSLENVVTTKFELADSVLSRNGMMFYNADNPFIAEKISGMPGIRYGTEHSGRDVFADGISVSREGLRFTIHAGETEIPVTTRLLGTHNVLNILAAAAVALHLQTPARDIAFAVSRLKPAPHRLEPKPFLGGALLIDDAYNANPEGSLEALRVLGSFEGMTRIVVTPGLVELGEREEECNRRLGEACAKNADFSIFVGEKRSVPLLAGAKAAGGECLLVMKTFGDALAHLRTVCDANTVVLFENDLPDNYAG